MYFIFSGFPLAKPKDSSFVDHFVHTSSKPFLDDTTARRKRMIEALSPSISAQAQSVAIEEYLPYVFSIYLAQKANKAQRKSTPYTWESTISAAKKPFSSVQIEFELAMTLINYACSLANFASFTMRDYFKTLKSGTGGPGSDVAKKSNHLFRRAAGVLEYVKNNLIPVLIGTLPLETQVSVIQSIIDVMLGQAQALTILIGKESNMNVMTLGRVAVGLKNFLQRAYTNLNALGGSGAKLPLAPPFLYNLQLVSTHYDSLAFYYIGEALYKKELPDCASAAAMYTHSLEQNTVAKKYKVYVGSSMDLETVAAFGDFVKKEYDGVLHDCTHVFYKEVPEFSQVQDVYPQEAIVAKIMDYEQPPVLCSEIQ